jgi:RNA polymerase sigma-70 factor (ECF subfamily)
VNVGTIAYPGMKSVSLPDGAAAERVEPSVETLQLFHEHGTSLYRFCQATLGKADEAEDVVQETFLKLLQHLESDGDRSNLRAWLFAVAANACRDRLRWRGRWLPWRAELDTRVVEDVGDRRDVRAARLTLHALAPRDRLLLLLRAQGLSYREIAAAAGVRETSVGRLLARALDRWKRGLRSYQK